MGPRRRRELRVNGYLSPAKQIRKVLRVDYDRNTQSEELKHLRAIFERYLVQAPLSKQRSRVTEALDAARKDFPGLFQSPEERQAFLDYAEQVVEVWQRPPGPRILGVQRWRPRKAARRRVMSPTPSDSAVERSPSPNLSVVREPMVTPPPLYTDNGTGSLRAFLERHNIHRMRIADGLAKMGVTMKEVEELSRWKESRIDKFLRRTAVDMETPHIYLMTAWEAENFKYAMMTEFGSDDI